VWGAVGSGCAFLGPGEGLQVGEERLWNGRCYGGGGKW
jgi:hypothetical protein